MNILANAEDGRQWGKSAIFGGARERGSGALARDHESRRAAGRLVATQGRRVASRLEALPRRVRRTFLGPVGPCRPAGHEKAPSGHAKSPAMRGSEI